MMGTETTTNLMIQLANIAFRSIVLAGGIGLLLVLFRVKQTSLRLFAWTGVLYAALGMPLLMWMLPSLPVRVLAPVPDHITAKSSSPANRVSARNEVSGTSGIRRYARSESVELKPVPVTPPKLNSATKPSSLHFWRDLQWVNVAALVYLAVALFLLVRFLAGLLLAQRLIARSQKIEDSRIRMRIAEAARSYRGSFSPSVFESEHIAAPITLGTIRPAILLPTDWREWDNAKLGAVIAHETSHVARGDAFTHSLSLLHRAIFWFSPLSWWLDRHLSDLAEQASDEVALSFGADRHAYARTLLEFCRALQLNPRRVRWQGVSMAKSGHAQQRLERILAWKGVVTMSVKKSVAVAVAILGIPLLYLAAAVRPVAQSSSTPVAPQTPAPSAAHAKSSETSAPVAATAPQVVATPAPDGALAAAPSSATATVAPAAEATPAPMAYSYSSAQQSSGTSSAKGYSYAYGYDDEERFVIVSGKSDGFTMSGSSQDARHVEKLKKTIPGDFIWFQRDEKSYIIRDQATVDRARALWAPQEELGKKQEVLGKQQEELGRKQEALGKKMEEVRVKVPDMTAELDRLKTKLQKLGPSATMEQIGDLQSEIGELQSKIGEIQSQAGEQQGKYGEEQGKLGEQQGKLGEQQGELGRQQGELAEKATREMKTLLDQALKDGTAKPEPESGHDGML